jgi:hypothetical protein
VFREWVGPALQLALVSLPPGPRRRPRRAFAVSERPDQGAGADEGIRPALIKRLPNRDATKVAWWERIRNEKRYDSIWSDGDSACLIIPRVRGGSGRRSRICKRRSRRAGLGFAKLDGWTGRARICKFCEKRRGRAGG